METKMAQKEKPKFAPPSARGKLPHAKKTTEAKDAEEKKEEQIHKETNEKITSDMEEQEDGIHELGGVDVKKAKTVSEKHRPLAGLGKKGTEGECKAVEKKVRTHGDQAGGMGKLTASQFFSETNDKAGREDSEKKEKKEKLKNKKQVLNTEGDEAGEKTTKKKQVLGTGETGAAQKDSKEKTKKEKIKPMLKIKEKTEREKKAPVALANTQYDDLFDSVLAASQLETCMEDAKAMLTEVELLQASIDQSTNKLSDENVEEEEGHRDSCKEREEEDQEVHEGRREETQGSYKDRKEPGAKSRSCQKRRREEKEEEEDDGKIIEYVSWVQCSRAACKKWRRLECNTDPSTLPKNWTCSENTDPAQSSCDAPQESWTVCKEEEFYYCSFVPGSLVWAQQIGYPWWPAMIERDPVTRNFLEFKTKRDPFPSKCHVTYMGSPVSRAWVQRCRVRDYSDLPEQAALSMVRKEMYKKKLKDAIKMAGQAEKLPLQKRLSKFGFMTRRATDGESLEEDSDIEEILGLFVESSGKGSGWRQRGKVSGDEVVKRPQKQKKQREGSTEEPREEGEAAREAETKRETECTEETGKKEDDADKKEECQVEEKSQAENTSDGVEQDRETDSEGREVVAGGKEKKQPADDEKERESAKKGSKEGKKGAERTESKRKGAELPSKRKGKEMQTALNKQDGEKTKGREEKVKEQPSCPIKESDDQAVPESEDQMESEQGEGEREVGTRVEPVAGKEEVKKRPKQEECVIEGLGLSDGDDDDDDDDGDSFLDTDLEFMACRDDLMKSFGCADEEVEEDDDFSIMVFEEE